MTPWRKLVYREISSLALFGKVLDVGGSKYSGYHELIKGAPEITVVNLDKGTGPDLAFDLEKPFPLKDGGYDAVLCINILEHIYSYSQFLSECRRVLKPGGSLVIAVPFLVQVHPSPNDYFRYTGQALERILKEQGFIEFEIKPLGTGVGLAIAQIAYNALRFAPLRFIFQLKGRIYDGAVQSIKKDSFLSKKNYPLGYFITARI